MAQVPDGRFALGLPGPMRDRLTSAVLRGEKTATCSLLDRSAGTVPRVGEQLTLVDSDESPIGVVELVEVEVMSLGEVELSLAVAEGEGFDSVAAWRRAHEALWVAEGLAPERRAARWRFDDATELLVERFRTVARLPLADGR
jgi:uncharacterized protein YhfF